MFLESRHGRAAEIVGWSNAFAAVGLGLAAYHVLALAPLWAAGVFVAAFVVLRFALAHKATLGLAALLGTLAVSAIGGGLAWTFAHVIESIPAAPQIAGVLGALLSAFGPAWAYATVARHRARRVPDSLIEPVSAPTSN